MINNPNLCACAFPKRIRWGYCVACNKPALWKLRNETSRDKAMRIAPHLLAAQRRVAELEAAMRIATSIDPSETS